MDRSLTCRTSRRLAHPELEGDILGLTAGRARAHLPTEQRQRRAEERLMDEPEVLDLHELGMRRPALEMDIGAGAFRHRRTERAILRQRQPQKRLRIGDHFEHRRSGCALSFAIVSSCGCALPTGQGRRSAAPRTGMR